MTLSRALLAAPFALLLWLWGRLAWVYPELPERIWGLFLLRTTLTF